MLSVLKQSIRLAVLCGISTALVGCGARTITFKQTPVVNTAMVGGSTTRSGDPLEIAVVCVTPEDLQNPSNDRLRPNSGITSREWHDRMPDGDADANQFVLPKNQVYWMTNRTDRYGKVIGNALRGAKEDGDAPVKKGGINFPSFALHDNQSVIYVFPLFKNDDGAVLETQPAVFHPPGGYEADLMVEIGVDENRSTARERQYIRILSEQKMHKN